MKGFHGIRYHGSTDSICQVVAVFLGRGLSYDEPALVIGTAEHRAGVRKFLRRASFSVKGLQQRHRLVMVDAAATLRAIMVNGTPDAVRFESVVGALLAGLGPVSLLTRVYDEMGDILWKSGQHPAALRLETLWDRLIGARDCSLLCGHGPDRPGQPAHALIALHSHVVAANGVPHRVVDLKLSGTAPAVNNPEPRRSSREFHKDGLEPPSLRDVFVGELSERYEEESRRAGAVPIIASSTANRAALISHVWKNAPQSPLTPGGRAPKRRS